MTLSADDYAVPEKRAMRIHDASAVRFAWDHVHATKGLTPDERKEARRRIMERAQQLGLDVTTWSSHTRRRVRLAPLLWKRQAPAAILRTGMRPCLSGCR